MTDETKPNDADAAIAAIAEQAVTNARPPAPAPALNDPSGPTSTAPADVDSVANGFDAMGKPIPLYRKQAAYDTCKAMGVNNPSVAWSVVNGMANALERDKPYDAMNVGGAHVDLTGVYRLMAVLLTAPRPLGS